MDLTLRGLDRRFFAGIGSTVVLGAGMVIITVIVLVWLLQRMVLTPLHEVVSTSERIVDGDLDSRTTVSQLGEFSHLAGQLNRMTDHLSQLIRANENQKTHLQAILDAIDDEIVVLDQDRRIVAANEAFRSRFPGATHRLTRHVCNESTDSSRPCGANQSGACPVQKAFDSGRVEKGMVSHIDSDGKEQIVEIHASPMAVDEGIVTNVVEVRRDISERRQLEAILAHSEHLASLGLLATGLSHEINNPLGAIATLVEGLRRRLPGDDRIPEGALHELDEQLRRVGAEVERGKTITHRLLKIARPSERRRSLVDINRVIEEIVAILEHDIKQSGIERVFACDPDLPLYRGDEAHVVQIFMNVCLNAVQAMKARGGILTIRTSSRDEKICVEIEDTGEGIRSEIKKRIYEPFFTTKPAGKGTGLGLFIVHQILSDLGGSIEIESELGRRTTVIMSFPADTRDSN